MRSNDVIIIEYSLKYVNSGNYYRKTGQLFPVADTTNTDASIDDPRGLNIKWCGRGGVTFPVGYQDPNIVVSVQQTLGNC